MKLDHNLFVNRMDSHAWDLLEDDFMERAHAGASPEFMEERRYNIKRWRTGGGENFVLTKTALEICQRIKIDVDKFDYSLLKNVVRPMATIHYSNALKDGKNSTLIRYFTKNNKLNCIMLSELQGVNENAPWLGDLKKHVKDEKLIFYCGFGIYLNTGEIVVEDSRHIEIFKQFMQIMSYIELSDTKHVVMKPRAKYRSDKKERFINLTQEDFYLVDASWNTYIHVGEFNVRGHFRWQRCGKENQSVKLVFIKEFKKSGYHRGPKKKV